MDRDRDIENLSGEFKSIADVVFFLLFFCRHVVSCAVLFAVLVTNNFRGGCQ